jgi:hypothetical protein
MDKVNTLLKNINVELPGDLDNDNSVVTTVSEEAMENINAKREAILKAIENGSLSAGDGCIIFKPLRPWKGKPELRFEEPDGSVMIAMDRHDGQHAKIIEAAAMWSKEEDYKTIKTLKWADLEVLMNLVLTFRLSCI